MSRPAGYVVRALPSASRRRARSRWLRAAFGSAGLLLAASFFLASLAEDPAAQAAGGADDPSPAPSGSPVSTADPSPDLEVARANCPVDGLRCHRLTVPIDPERPDAGTLRVVFGRHLAEDERQGTLVIATGGPGSSGLEAAAYYLQALPPAVLDRFDVVFFDQRGVGRSSRLDCRLAELSAPPNDVRGDPSPAYETAISAWVTSCLDEADTDAAMLAAYDTARVADDIEAYRRHIDAEEIYLYGESYGTAVVQYYAAHYPERVAGVVLDAPIDTSLDGFGFLEGQLGAFWDVTLQTVAACAEDVTCAAELGDRPVEAWQAFLDQLETGPLTVDYPVGEADVSSREMSFYDVANAALTMMYAEYDRMLFLRALAAAVDGEPIPMLTLAYMAAGLDPATLEPIVGHSRGTALFLAVQCRDYADVPDRSAGMDGLRAVHAALTDAGNRYADLVWDDLACLHGFTELGTPIERPGAPSGDFATLVLTASADPATPTAWAERLAREASDGYLIRTEGGPHVTFGAGFRCPDDLVVDFLLYDERPRDAETVCDGYVVDLYMPRLLDSLDAYTDVGEALIAIEQELVSRPEYSFWDGSTTSIACDDGGWFTLSWTRDADRYLLEDCALIDGWPLDGVIRYNQDGTTTMELTAPNASLSYESSTDWRVTVSGTLDDRPVDIRRRGP